MNRGSRPTGDIRQRRKNAAQVAAHELRNAPPVQEPSPAAKNLRDARELLASAKEFAASVPASAPIVEPDDVAERHAGDVVDAIFRGDEDAAKDALVHAIERLATPKPADAETRHGVMNAALARAFVDYPELSDPNVQQHADRLIRGACGGRELEQLDPREIAIVVATATQLAVENRPQAPAGKAENAALVRDPSDVIAAMRKVRVGYHEVGAT